MDKTSKILWISTWVFIIATFLYIGIQRRKIDKLEDRNQLQAIELSVLNDSVSVYKNRAGELTYKLSVVEISHANLKESLELAGWNIKELKAKDVEWRKITNALKLQLETVGSGEAVIRDTLIIAGRDSIISQKFNWSNNYLTLNGDIDIDRVQFGYFYRTGIEVLQSESRKKTIVSVSLSDPNAAITHGNGITILHTRKWWDKPWLWGIVGFGAGLVITR